MSTSIGRLAGITLSAALFAAALWQWGVAQTALQVVIGAAVLALLGRLQRKRPVEHKGWKVLTPGGSEWLTIVVGGGLLGIFAWIFFFVGSARHDAESQMQVLQLLIAAFAGMTAFALYTSCMMATRWNDARIEQEAWGFGKRSISFTDICELSPVEWASILRIEAVDGTRIYVLLYQNGAAELVDDLKAKLGIAERDEVEQGD
jgi:hypothetical protein